MMKLITVLLFVAVASAAFSHGITGSFNAIGRVNWQGWGYWSKATKRWVPLRPPTFNGGFTPSRSQIVGTSDGGAIVVGSFTSVNGRTAAGVATYDPTTDNWYPANEVGLYNIPTTNGAGGQINCLAPKSQGAAYISPSARTKAPFVWSISTDATQNDAQYAIQTPVVVDDNTGRSPILDATNPNRQNQATFHSVGEGRIIMADSANADTFYVFGNFYHVGADVEAPHNAGLTAAGFVQFTYNPTTKLITPGVLTGNYEARVAGSTQDQLHARHCGHRGAQQCAASTADPATACTSLTPHSGAGAVTGGFTREGANLHFFIVTGSDVLRWTTGTKQWVSITANDGSDGRAGTGVNLGPLCSDSMTGCGYNIRGSPGFNFQVAPNHDQVWLLAQVYPADDDWGVNSPNGDEGSVQGWSQNAWDAPAVPNTLRLFGGAKSTDLAGQAWVSAYTTDNLPIDIFRNKGVQLPNFPARRSTAVNIGSVQVTAKDATIFFSDERYPGTTATRFNQNILAHSRFLGVHEVTGTAAAVSIQSGTGQPHWSVPTNTVNGNDDNGNPLLAWSSANNLARFVAVRKESNGDIYMIADTEILYDPILPAAGDAGHHPDNGGLYWKKSFGGGWAVKRADGTWARPFGGGLSGLPITSWERSVEGTDRVYFFSASNLNAHNFAAQSGVAVYDPAKYEWVDPLGDWRLVSLTTNNYDPPTGNSQMGADGVANIIHFQGSEFIIAGRFSFIGDAHYGSIFVWDGVTPGTGFKSVGSATTGLYKNNIAPGKQLMTKLAPSTTNRKVTEGTVRTLTNSGKRLYVGGDFDRSSNDINSGNWISNIATISDFADTSATWQAVDNGCNQQVRQLIVFGDYLYAGGDFTWCGGPHRVTPTTGIARIHKDVAVTRRWEGLGLGIEGSVQAMITVDPGVFGGGLIVGGSFTSADGSGFDNFAAWTGSRWITTMPNRCDNECDKNPLGVAMAKGTSGWLGARPQGTVLSLIATDRVWAVLANGQAASAGTTAAREIVYYTGSAWYRPTNGALVAGADNYNGLLAVNGTDGSIMLANAQLPKNGLSSVGGFTSNYVHLSAANTGEVHRFQNYPGHHGTDGTINHFGAAGSITVSIAVIAAVLLAAL